MRLVELGVRHRLKKLLDLDGACHQPITVAIVGRELKAWLKAAVGMPSGHWAAISYEPSAAPSLLSAELGAELGA